MGAIRVRDSLHAKIKEISKVTGLPQSLVIEIAIAHLNRYGMDKHVIENVIHNRYFSHINLIQDSTSGCCCD